MAEKICADSSQKLNIVFGALAVITDAMLMAIPLWTLPKLHISFSKKITLYYWRHFLLLVVCNGCFDGPPCDFHQRSVKFDKSPDLGSR
jgi:hypothetical protein